MPEPRTQILVALAIASLLLPAAFLAAIGLASMRRRRGHEPGPAWSGLIAFLGGASLGTMFVIADDLLLGAPLGLVVLGVAFGQWRAGRRSLAAWLALGASLPWTFLWGAYMVLYSRGAISVDPLEAVVAFLAGAVPGIAALVVLLRRMDTSNLATEPAQNARPQRRIVRSFHTVGTAMREPSRLGPFGMPEVAALIALVASYLSLTAIALIGVPPLVGYGLAVVAGSALATEAYLRALAPRTRRSMEAFMWLGGWDMAQIRAATGAGVPTTRAGAAQWLARHPEPARGATAEPALVASLRVELNLLAGRVAEARAVVERLPESNPSERFTKIAAADIVAWWTATGDATEAMAAAIPDIGPAGDDDRLRAEVALAIARVRHLAVAVPPPADPLAPLLDVRDRLGARADGIVRRILWPRLYRVFVLTSIVFAVAGVATGVSGPLL